MRAPFQVIVLPYRVCNNSIQILVCKRSDDQYWQCVSGGGELAEKSIDAAIRELNEETGLTGIDWQKLDSQCTVPKCHFRGNENWKEHPYVIPEYAFSVLVTESPVLSCEHTEYKWCDEREAIELLQYDSNKNAVWELYQRLNLVDNA
ncbi:NUDIX hydrolase [Vibrio porteresiae]|uniref:NUDIX pyrophosphatase n=1 Tax=Vibrio porteresiae DSM 19223 TaxID=1123496 RepID=A0ABZ0Q9C3_9VIBR|nr:NUDIX pyrophosphatase [Vibrio porteresiae]WPC73043.1 NUDIX pyrophosphatase [Vibrio porteresiae DSM 19223]